MLGLSTASIRFLQMVKNHTSNLRDFLSALDIPVSATARPG